MDIVIVLSYRRQTLAFNHREAYTERISLEMSIRLVVPIKKLFIPRGKQPSRRDTGNSFYKGLASSSSKAVWGRLG
jgi:hypothetical protein